MFFVIRHNHLGRFWAHMQLFWEIFGAQGAFGLRNSHLGSCGAEKLPLEAILHSEALI